MKVAVMQPYFFPYIGYFQLIKAVDYFVIFDDVNYIKRGWVSKNRILHNGNIIKMTLPIQKASQNRKINQHIRSIDLKALDKIKKQLQSAYCKAPNFKSLYPLLGNIIDNPEQNLALYLTHLLTEISAFMEINTQFIYASELSNHDDWDSAQDRIIDLTKTLGGTEYYNLPGGRDLYDQQRFAKQNINLKFITPDLNKYSQAHTDSFIPGLSVIDYLMCNERD